MKKIDYAPKLDDRLINSLGEKSGRSDHAAFNEVMRTLSDFLYNAAWAAAKDPYRRRANQLWDHIEEATAAAMRRAWRHRTKYQADRGNYTSWLRTIVANCVRTQLGRSARRARMLEPTGKVTRNDLPRQSRTQ